MRTLKRRKLVVVFAILFLFSFGVIGLWSFVPTATSATSTFYSTTADGYTMGGLGSWDACHHKETGFVEDAVDQSMIDAEYDALTYTICRSFVYFDTSGIPDGATIISATLSLYGSNKWGDTDFYIIIREGMPTYPHVPIEAGDHYYIHYSGNGGQLYTSGWTTSGYNGITLNSDGRSWINKQGTTKFMLTTDYDVDDTSPYPDKYWVIFWTANKGSGYKPKLVVTYGHSPVIGTTTVTSTSGYWYSQYTTYSVSVPVSDLDGYANIIEVRIRLGDSSHEYKWAGTTFVQVIDTGNYYTLQVGGTYGGSGNVRTVVFKLKVNWWAGDGLKTVYAYAKDNEGLTDGWDNEGNLFTVESDLSASSLNVDDYRVNPSQTLTMNGLWIYQGSASVKPPNGNYQVRVKLDGIQKGSTDTTLVGGVFYINDVTAESTVGSYSYTVEATYMSGAGSFDAVVVDRIEIYYQQLDDSRVNLNTNIEFRAKARLDYDNHPLGSGDSITANSGSMTWDSGNSWFEDWRSEPTATSYVFTVSSGSEATYGITALYIGVSNPTGIWDRLMITVSANVTNPTVGDTVGFTVTATYDYDSSSVTFSYINTLRNGTHYGEGTSFTDNQVSELTYFYTAENASDNTYAITTFSSNTATVMWGGLFIEAYEIEVDDTRASVDSNVYLRYHLRFSGNQSDVGSGTIWINGTSHSISSAWANFTVTYSSVNKNTYVETAVDVNGETDYGQIPANPEIIWDRIKIIGMGNDDGRRDVDTSGTLWATAVLEYDNHALGSGDSLTISDISMPWSVSNTRFEGTDTKSSVQSVTYNTFTTGNEATYGITAGTMNGYSTTIVWDRIRILTLGSVDSRIDVGSTATIYATADLQHDGHALGSGDSVTIAGIALSWVEGNSRFEGTDTKNTVQPVTYNVFTSGSEASYGITAGDMNSQTTMVIWDGLNVSSHQIDIENAKLYVQMVYAYDGTSVSNGNVSYIGSQSLTNSTGWAEYSLMFLTDFSYNEIAWGIEDSAYEITYKAQNQTVPLAKKVFVVQNLNASTTTLGSFSFASNQLNFYANGTGYNIFKVHATSTMYYLKINNIVYLQGHHWSRTGNVITVTDTLGSTHSYLLSFRSLEPPVDDRGGTGPRPAPTEQAKEFVEEVVARSVVAITSNWVSVLLLSGLVLGTVTSYSLDREGDSWKLLLVGFIVLTVNFLFAFILIPMEVVPTDLTILRNLAWKPPSLELQTYPLQQQALIQVSVLSFIFVTMIGSIAVLIIRRE